MGAVVIAAVICPRLIREDKVNSSIFDRHRFIGHAFGKIDSHTYTNSLEAFNANYEKGRRVFEVDFAITADRTIVCFHEGSEGQFGLKKTVRSMTHKEFKDAKILRRYTTMDVYDLVGLMHKHDDIYIVTDLKRNLYDFTYIISVFVQEAYKTDPEIAKRIIPQVYDESTYSNAMFLYPFPETIYTLYRTNSSDASVIGFLKQNENITGLTVSRNRFNTRLAKAASDLDRAVFVHTINNPKEIESFRGKGADGFYTDSYFE
jgi:glycerophosphoryl diester phosphodiesterase